MGMSPKLGFRIDHHNMVINTNDVQLVTLEARFESALSCNRKQGRVDDQTGG
jgi:hypothetical protein